MGLRSPSKSKTKLNSSKSKHDNDYIIHVPPCYDTTCTHNIQTCTYIDAQIVISTNIFIPTNFLL